MKEIELWKFIQKKLSNNHTVALLVVADSNKSSPGRKGFKMALSDDNETAGTIGGGIMEHIILEEAVVKLINKEITCTIRRLSHNKNASVNPSGLICGGTQTVIIKIISPSEKIIVEDILKSYENLDKGLLIINQSGISFLHTMVNEKAISLIYSNDEWQYEEISGFPNTVYIIGGGHVGLAVSRVMSTLDFYVVTIDPRKDISTMTRNIYADKKLNIHFDEASRYIVEGDRSYIVIVTSGHDSDRAVLQNLITGNFKYIGMMGSKNKIKMVFKDLVDKGVDPQLLSKVNTPIGVEIEAESPEEIAVSIAAEIIKTKNKRGEAAVI
jgi:xanthine dehydrogenase accessory factor